MRPDLAAMRPDLEESFDAFVRARGDHHLRVAALTGSATEAEDLVQSSLVKLYRAWPRLDVDPGTFLAQLEKAGTVTDEGPASGPGWTGTKYAFAVRAGKNGPVAVSGTVDVTFSHFGESVQTPAAPPASQVYNYGKQILGYFPI
jgi:Sigma-70 region 2